MPNIRASRSEQKAPLVFRYYDPRVLRVYLPTCSPAEFARFFGPISAGELAGLSDDDVRRPNVSSPSDGK